MSDFRTVHRWEQWLRAQGHAEDTIRVYSYGVFLLGKFAGESIKRIRHEHVTAFLATLKPKSVSREKYFLGIRSLFGYCRSRRVVRTDPTIGIPNPRARKRRRVALNKGELERYFAGAEELGDRALGALMLQFGLGTRRSETVRIRPDDIEGSKVRVVGKGGKERYIDVGPVAQEALEILRPWWNGTVLGGVAKGTLTNWATAAAKKAGLWEKVKGRSSHVLRASFISHLLNENVPSPKVRDLAGHESLATTDEYAVALDDTGQEDVRKLPRPLRRPRRKPPAGAGGSGREAG